MCALWQTAQGQGTKADYERAYALRGVIGGKVFKERISPHWVGGPHFWYENRLRDGREWVLVDGRVGKRQHEHGDGGTSFEHGFQMTTPRDPGTNCPNAR